MGVEIDSVPLTFGKRMLVPGTGVAGNTPIWWLAWRGFEVTDLDRHPSFRDGGQNIDVRGAARDVLNKMDLEASVAGNGTGEVGIRFVDESYQTIAEFRVDETGSDGPTVELEMLRGDPTRISHIAETSDAAKMSFMSGASHTYDIAVMGSWNGG